MKNKNYLRSETYEARHRLLVAAAIATAGAALPLARIRAATGAFPAKRQAPILNKLNISVD